MSSSSLERKSPIHELFKCQDLATELLNLLQLPHADGALESATMLTKKIRSSLSQALLALKPDQEGCQGGAESCHRTSTSVDGKAVVKRNDGKGSHKRRRTVEKWTKMTASPLDDGYAWRKYGQKEIIDAKYPRCYFRCTHRDGQHCAATKQVQRMEDDSSMYMVTYMGVHTCRDPLLPPPIVIDYAHGEEYNNFKSRFIARMDSTNDALICESNEEYKNGSNEDKSATPDLFPPFLKMDRLRVDLTHEKCFSSSSRDVDSMVDLIQYEDMFEFCDG